MKRIDSYAKVLSLLASKKLLEREELKPMIIRFLRTGTETGNFHATAHYRSMNASKKIGSINRSDSAYHKFCSNNLSHDHIVPCCVQYDMLLNSIEKDEGSIKAFMEKFGRRATITREENEKLSKNSLSRKMPKGFYEKGNKLYNNPLARYIETGIEYEVMPKRKSHD